MTTESLSTADKKIYTWSDLLNADDYVFATYYVESVVDPELAAIAMAKEQSATTARIKDYQINPDMAARVVNIEVIGTTDHLNMPQFWLHTHAYPETGKRAQGYWQVRIILAHPLINFNNSLTLLWNAVVGELIRLGYINAMRLMDLDLPEEFIRHCPGPQHGMRGIREMLNIPDRPLFCRSTRPAVGLDLQTMCTINEQVLRGGFDIVKDDELTAAYAAIPYRDRVTALAQNARRVEQETGERKLYFANIIDDLSNSFEQLQIAEAAGADGVIIAPAIQGLAFASELVKRSRLLVLAHNSVDDIYTRHPGFGVSPAVYLQLIRLSGADLVFLPGAFSTPYVNESEAQAAVVSCHHVTGEIRPACPIIAGGKRPEHLGEYIKTVGSTDFMIIAATSVDEHPEGLEAGAQAFRRAWNQLGN